MFRWRSRKGLVAVALLGFLASAGSVPAQTIDGEGRNYDARVLWAREAAAPAVPEPAQAAAEERLRAAMPELLVSHHPETGALQSLYNPAGALTGPAPAGVEPLERAVAWLEENATLLGLSAADLADFEVTDQVPGEAGGTTHLYLRQRHGGLAVYNGQIQVHLDGEGRILSVNNDFLPDLALGVKDSEPALSAAEAVESAAKHLGVSLLAAPSEAGKPEGVERRTRVDVAGLSLEPVEARLMLLPVRKADARRVWNFQIHTLDSQHVYDMTVDARPPARC